MKAADISDETMLATIGAAQDAVDPSSYWASQPKETRWTFLSDIQKRLPAFPKKVVLAKLASMIRRGVVRGCACGCRGDFVPE